MYKIVNQVLLSIVLLCCVAVVNAQEDSGKELLIEECENVSEIFDELAYYTTEIEAIKRRKTKGYYSKEEFPYEMLDLSMRKFVKKKITKAEFNFFTHTMKNVDNYIAAIENKLNKHISDQKMGFDNKAEQQRFRDAQLAAEQAFAKDKAQLDVNCINATKDSKKTKKKNKN
ncbi:hypothetical protein [Carboxylicivirga marina]|nr:hypothetical protein [Carboxylicivirga marina]